jgi:cysteine desulfurase/selenocysteine lyase
MFDPQEIKKDFPIFNRVINGQPLVYLDSAATTQKPYQVIEALVDYYQNHNANIHRGIHTLAEEATALYEGAREKVRAFIGASSSKEIIFVRNSTEALNLVARTWGEVNLSAGDEILLTVTEHHSNLVPWQLLAQRKGLKLKFLELDNEGNLQLSDLTDLLTERTKFISMTHVSNVLGVINPVEKIVEEARRRGVKVLLDCSQSVPRLPVNVSQLGVDFLAFTGHKMLGPTGIGVLWARQEILEAMPPFLAGGDMIKEVTLEKAVWNDLPHKFEAGTPNIAGAIGLGAAVGYLSGLGMENVYRHEKELAELALLRLSTISGVEIYGPQHGGETKTGVIAFNLEGVHAHDLAQVLDSVGVAVRSGHHCAMPLMKRLGIPACVRASFYIYNTNEDIDRLIEGIKKAKKVFGA